MKKNLKGPMASNSDEHAQRDKRTVGAGNRLSNDLTNGSSRDGDLRSVTIDVSETRSR